MSVESQTFVERTRKRSSSRPRKRARLSDATEPSTDHIYSHNDTRAKHRSKSEAFVNTYPAMAKSSLERGISILEELISKTWEYHISEPRKLTFTTECRRFIRMIEQGEDVKPITAREYGQRIQQPIPDWENVVVICTSKEARNLLQRYDLCVPLLVPLELNDSPEPRSLVPMAHYESILRFRRYAEGGSFMDIQDLSTKRVIRKLKIDTAFERMNEPIGLPINFLNIRPVRRNILPWEIDNILDYSILHEASEYGGMSNHGDTTPLDLSNKDNFALWGKKGVWSSPHIDEHGLYTGVLCEEGEKLWYTWSLTDEEREQLASSREQSNRYHPKKPGFPIVLRKGDVLIMPPGTVHAPLSLTNVVMHGFHVWCTRTMVRTARCALLDLRYPTCTNEEPRKELRNKLQHLVRASKARLPPYTWGDKEDYRAFAAVVKLILLELDALEAVEKET